MGRPHLRLVPPSEPDAKDKPCDVCAFVVAALFFGAFDWLVILLVRFAFSFF